MNEIIGRQKEIEKFSNFYHSKKAEFIAVYGRRRIGKTFIVRQLYQNEWCFYHTGLSPMESEQNTGSMKERQLLNFASSLRQFGSNYENVPATWMEAFDQLIDLLRRYRKRKRCVVFIDELPWMDTDRSGFMSAFEHFWNGWASAQPNIMLIVCGSATSWMEDKLINNKGGLYGRITGEIHLAPFTLEECNLYYASRGIKMDYYDQVQCYMIMGGVPFYMDYLQKSNSLAQNIDQIFFDSHAPLRNEFERLFTSLFVNPDTYIKVVKLLAARREGFLRSEIATLANIPYGGGLTKILTILRVNDFIVDYIPYGRSQRERRYRLTDSFCLFYLHFMEKKKQYPTFWQDNLLSPSLNAWRGFSFETVCFCHINKIKEALGITGVHCEIAPCRLKSDNGNHQIDLVIDRADRVVNLCEIKYANSEYVITKKYDMELRSRTQAFMDAYGSRKTVHLTMITTYGLSKNEYTGHIQKSLTIDAFF